jgi:2'-5' RNA ligase
MGYHLWLTPWSGPYERLARTITELGRHHGAPLFEPHVTLLGHLPGTEVEIIQRVSRLAEDLHRLEMRLTAPGFSDEYFQCLFLHVEPSPPLLAAHAKARECFAPDCDVPYLPHLSLLYGHFSIDVKKEIIARLPKDLAGPFTVDRLDLIRADSDDPKDWHRLQTIPFGAGPEGG